VRGLDRCQDAAVMAAAIGEVHFMGDKSPKSKEKGAKQKGAQAQKTAASAKAKQEKAPATAAKKK
jgi:hypothetical protein